MNKKLISLLLCLAMTAGLAVGCGTSGETEEPAAEGEATTLTMWVPPLDADT